MPETLTRSPTDVDELERLWSAPAAVRRPARRRRAPSFARVGNVLVFAWPSTLAVVIFAAPAAENAATPLWADVVAAAFFVCLAGMVVGALMDATLAFAGSALAGALGTVLGVACRATEHHTGAWWIYETASFAALALLSAAGLARSLKTST